jgi:hypothetical protein
MCYHFTRIVDCYTQANYFTYSQTKQFTNDCQGTPGDKGPKNKCKRPSTAYHKLHEWMGLICLYFSLEINHALNNRYYFPLSTEKTWFTVAKPPLRFFGVISDI